MKFLCRLILALMIATYSLPGSFAQPAESFLQSDAVPYWSDTQKQSKLMRLSQDHIFGDPTTQQDAAVKGAIILANEARQLQSSIESDVLNIIKTNRSDEEKVESIKRLVYRILAPIGQEPFTEPYDPDDAKPYFGQFGILNYIGMYLTVCPHSINSENQEACKEQSWYGYPNGTNETSVMSPGDLFSRNQSGIDYYRRQANINRPLSEKIGFTPDSSDGAYTGSGLYQQIQAYLTRLDTDPATMLELRTAAVHFDGTRYIGVDGPTEVPGDALTLPEYALAATELYNIVSPTRSLITGQAFTFWGHQSATHRTLVEVAEDFRAMAYARSKAIYEKARSNKRTQFNKLNELTTEIISITGTIPASPYDMDTVVNTLIVKLNDIEALSGPCPAEAAENGFRGCYNAQFGVEVMDYINHESRMAASRTELEEAREKVIAYRAQYERSPNLSDQNTQQAFGDARKEIIDARDALLRHLNELAELSNQRISEADTSLGQLRDVVGAQLESTAAVNALWGEMRRALNNLVNWLLSIFGRSLNFGLTEVGDNGNLRHLHQISVNMANVLFVLMLALAGLAISMEWTVPSYSLRTILPRFFASVFLVNFSLAIFRTLIDASLIVTNILLSQASRVGLPGTEAEFVEIFARTSAATTGSVTLGLSGAAPGLLFGSLLSSNVAELSNSVFQNDISAVLILLIILVIVAAVDILLIIRTAGLWLLIVAIPLVIPLLVLPHTKHILWKLFKYFIALLVIGPIISVIFLVGVFLAQLSLVDDFLRVLIGIGTFALMLFIPFFGGSIKDVIKLYAPDGNNPNAAQNVRNIRNNLPPDPSGNLPPGGPSSKPSGSGGVPFFKNIFPEQPPQPPAGGGSLNNLPPSAVSTAVKSGILANIPPEDIEKIFKKMDEKQKQAFLSTVEKNDKNGQSLWSDSHKKEIYKIVDRSQVDRASNTASVIEKARNLKQVNVNKFIQKNQSQTLGIDVGRLKSALENRNFTQLRLELGKINAEAILPRELVASILRIEQGIKTVADMLSGLPQEKHVAQNIVSTLHEHPQVVKQLISNVQANKKPLSTASNQLLQAGIVNLNAVLQAETEDDLITQLNKAVEVNLEAEPLLAKASGKAAAQTAPPLMVKTQLPVSDGVEFDIPAQLNLEAEPLLAKVRGKATPQSAQPLTMQADVPAAAEQTLNVDQVIKPRSIRAIRRLADQDISQLTTADVSLLINKSEKGSLAARQTLNKVINQYQSQSVEARTDAPVDSMRAEISALGFGLKLTQQELNGLRGEISIMINTPADAIKDLGEKFYQEAIRAFSQVHPENIKAEHIQFAVERMELNAEVYRPLAQELLSNNKISDEAFVDGLSSMIQKNASAVLPDHISRSVEGLKQNPATFARPTRQMAAKYNEAGGDYGGEGQLSLAATAELSRHQTDIAQALPEGTLTPGVNPHPEVNAETISAASKEEMLALPTGVTDSGLDYLLDNAADEITAEQAEFVMARAQDKDESALPLVQKMAEEYSASLQNNQSTFSAEAGKILESQKESMSEMGINLGESHASRGAEDGLGSLEDAIHSIPQASTTETQNQQTNSLDNRLDREQLSSENTDKILSQGSKEASSQNIMDDSYGSTGQGNQSVDEIYLNAPRGGGEEPSTEPIGLPDITQVENTSSNQSELSPEKQFQQIGDGQSEVSGNPATEDYISNNAKAVSQFGGFDDELTLLKTPKALLHDKPKKKEEEQEQAVPPSRENHSSPEEAD